MHAVINKLVAITLG